MGGGAHGTVGSLPDNPCKGDFLGGNAGGDFDPSAVMAY